MSKIVVAVDPGWYKSGIAVGTKDKILEQMVVPAKDAAAIVTSLVNKYRVSTVAVGDCTCSDKIVKALNAALPENIDIALTNEWFSTMEGRKLYFKENPPRGWRRLIPTSLQTPPRSIDDYAAVVILKRHFKENG